jgi:hypothetical protein
MTDRTKSTVRAARWALLPAMAAIALFASLPAAVAADQQASDEAAATAQGHFVAGVDGEARAQVPAPVHHRHHAR